MVVRSGSRHSKRTRPGPLTIVLAGATLAVILVPGGPAGADRPGSYAPPVHLPVARISVATQVAAGGPALVRLAPVPDDSLGPGGVTFEVLPIPPSASPTGAPTSTPTPSPSKSGGNLPVTGDRLAPSGWVLAVGVLLLLLGALVVTASARARRRRA
ncbi:hypothetical protein ACI2K4_18850 [Micromonospora sp. NPDC050397]|uniref:hypothetical protein n=1 Tax=Micromonospora sp. NPDC050397 TaxID=3364279 RepID=UPI00384D7851